TNFATGGPSRDRSPSSVAVDGPGRLVAAARLARLHARVGAGATRTAAAVVVLHAARDRLRQLEDPPARHGDRAALELVARVARRGAVVSDLAAAASLARSHERVRR